MGYWSEHPMGGDDPLDVRDELMHWILGKMSQEDFARANGGLPGPSQYGSIEEARKDVAYRFERHDFPAYQALISRLIGENIDELIKHVNDDVDSDYHFALPFMIADEFNIREDLLTEERLAALIGMIGDGGGDERDYSEDTEEECPQKYAKELEDNARARLTGKVTDPGSPGLLEIIGDMTAGDAPIRFVNIK